MRMRVLTRTNKGKLLAIADEVTKLIEADGTANGVHVHGLPLCLHIPAMEKDSLS